ncbi:MAG TPA: hypothetical protein VN451_10985, partial [Chitinophagaceae bacterium]|nr:hypothetical protein [Chitinophagaceae bacterium]
MKFFIYSLLSIIIFSCNPSADKKVKKENNNTPPVSATTITEAQIPASAKYEGKLQEAWQWTDKSGDNILITSLVEPYADKDKNEYDEEGWTAALSAYQYLKKDGDYQLLWKINDGEKSCPFDITCGFIKGATSVTDLDNDGIAEATILYRLACRSDVSPAEMKIIMYEGAEKYFLQGLSWLKSSPEDSFTVTENTANLETLPGYNKTEDEFMKTFGRYDSEKGFAGAPPEFLNFARKQWMKFVQESFE